MNRKELYQQILAKKSMLCVGLDVDFDKMPEHVKALAASGELAVNGELFKGKARAIVEFNKAIIDATADHCVAYKPNLAFYECYGIDGMRALDATVDYIRTKYPEIFLIADAKRGDIGNTAKMYAKAFFEEMDFDAVTIAPYMGADSVTPFLEYGSYLKCFGISVPECTKGWKASIPGSYGRDDGDFDSRQHDVCGRSHQGRQAPGTSQFLS